jgi:AcrR family transcriptional regulator
MLLDAAMTVMAKSGYDAASVNDVLAQAGLSTRSFYRQFDSKQALLVALIERERQVVADSLAAAVAAADEPVAGVEAWIDAFLDRLYEPERAARTHVFTSPSVLASYSLATAMPEMHKAFCPPLVRALKAGHRDGLLFSPNPKADAQSILSLATSAVDVRQHPFPRRSVAKTQVLRFAWPAIGLPRPENGSRPQ